MSEESEDDSSKTEEPSQRKLEEARKKGQVANSREISYWMMILSIAVVMMVFVPLMGRSVTSLGYQFVTNAHDIRVEMGGGTISQSVIIKTLGIVIAPLVVLMLGAFLGHFLQNGFLFSGEKIQPQLDRISLIEGAKRVFSRRSVVELVKACAKLVIVTSVLYFMLRPNLRDIDITVSFEPLGMLDLLHRLTVKAIMVIFSVLTFIAAADWLYQRLDFLRQMRMSKQELKEEFKQTEGDPYIKRRITEIRNERARKRMMAAVPQATVVVTNPTHYAVALRYEDGVSAVPMVVAKGIDTVAMRIREVAQQHDVPIIQNPPVARALYADVELDAAIPRQHFEIVAKIIGYVLRLKGKIPGPPGPPPTAPADS